LNYELRFADFGFTIARLEAWVTIERGLLIYDLGFTISDLRHGDVVCFGCGAVSINGSWNLQHRKNCGASFDSKELIKA